MASSNRSASSCARRISQSANCRAAISRRCCSHAGWRRISGLAVLLSASELEELTAVADRAVVIRYGETVAQLDGSQMNEASIMDAIAYGASEQSTLAEAVEDAKHDR